MKKYERAKKDILLLLEERGTPMTIHEMHDALIWSYDFSLIRFAVTLLVQERKLTTQIEGENLSNRYYGKYHRRKYALFLTKS